MGTLGALAAESRVRLACLRQVAPLVRGLTLTSPISGILMIAMSRAPLVPSLVWVGLLVVPSLAFALTVPRPTASPSELERWERVLNGYILFNQAVWASSIVLLRPAVDQPEVQTAQLVILVAVANSLVLLGAFVPRLFHWALAVLGGAATVELLLVGIGFNRYLALAVPVYAVILLQLQRHMRAATERSIRLALENELLLRELGREQERLEHEASHDHLTGLFNRAAFLEEVDRRLADVPPGRVLAVAFADLDHFKEVNDLYGHVVGDRVLAEVARRLRDAVRSDDVVGRFGGDEFTVLLGPVADVDTARHAGARITAAFDEPILVEGRDLPLGVSVGIGVCGRERCAADDLIALADQALYAAKAAGRHRVEVMELAGG